MTRPVIVVGDKTDHGGTVLTGAPTATTGGKPIARVGDKITCPRPDCVARGMGTNQIVSGDPTLIIDDYPAARHGDKGACGCTLLASQIATSVGTRGMNQAAAAKPAAQKVAAQGAMPEATLSPANPFIQPADE